MERKSGLAALAMVAALLSGDQQIQEAMPSIQPASLANTHETSTAKPKPFDTNKYNVLIGAGDIARCDNNADERTADLIKKIPGVVFTAGDNVYPSGSRRQFRDCYEPSWGDFKWRTKPAIGNHDIRTNNGRPYYNYFGEAAGKKGEGFYSYDMADGKWHVIVINSNIDYKRGSKQESWLQKDLAKHKKAHKIAIWHHPLFTVGEAGGHHGYKKLWEDLQKNDTKIIINGHAHSYQRFDAQKADGRKDPNGIREFVVGTGGARLRELPGKNSNLEVKNNKTYGVLKLTLNESNYKWEFIPAKGSKFKDSGTQIIQPQK